MKKIVLSLFLCALSISCSAQKEENTVIENNSAIEQKNTAENNISTSSEGNNTETSDFQQMQLCGFETGIITYKISGFSGGQQVLHFKDWGFKNIINQQRIINQTQTQERIILLEDYTYEISAATNRYIRKPSTHIKEFKIIFEECGDNAKADSLLMIRSGATYLGTEEIMGKSCQKWDAPASHAINWKWKGIIMKSEMTLPIGKMIYEVTDMQLDVPVPDLLFEVPNVKWVDKSITN